MKKFSVFAMLCLVVGNFLACDDSVSGTSDGMSSVSETLSSSVVRSSSSKQVSELEKATADFDAVEDGVIHFAEDDATKGYIYDDGNWRYAYPIEISVGQGCVQSANGKYVASSGKDLVCKWSDIPAWLEATVFEIPKENYFNKDIEYGTVKDERDGHVYKTVELRGTTWMAENLAYTTARADCKDSLTVGCFYKWEEALAITDDDTVASVRQGICMEGWHVPDTSEWNALFRTCDYMDLYSQVGWQIGENETGFSIVPSLGVETYTAAGPKRAASYVLFITNNMDNPPIEKFYSSMIRAYFELFQEDKFALFQWTDERGADFSGYAGNLRCVKDYE